MSEKRSYVLLVLWAMTTILLAFPFTSMVIQAQDKTTLEQRVLNLEREVVRLQASNMQFQNWVAGRYLAMLYSTSARRVVFENDLSWRKAHYQGDPSIYPYTCYCRIGDYKHITLYDGEGNILDSFDYGNIIKPGDLLVAWYSSAKLGETPTSPGLGLFPDYWNPSTGLAVAFLQIDGSYKRNS